MSSNPAANQTAKKWYEDDDLTISEKENDESQFSQGNIGTGFDAIKVKIQEMYEIGILKLFIETEILKSGSGSFEPSFKELYNPQTMTKPFQIGKELLFTSDVEFSEAGFLPGSLQDDRRKYFLNRLAFNNYLLRLPKPISDIETPVKEKTDSNAYKYLQILGSEEQNRIIILCDKFGENYVNKERGNLNAIIKLKKELSDIKLLAVGPTLTQDAKTKLEEAKQKELIKEENKKNKLETKKKNYKAACKILSNAIRRAQYNVTLEESRAETIKDANSLSTTIVDWIKYKQNSPEFFREVLKIFKPMLSNQAEKDKDGINKKIEELVRSLSSIFQPIFETYFYDKLNNHLRHVLPAKTERDDRDFINSIVIPGNRTNDPLKYSWNNINSTLKRVYKLTFATLADKDVADKLYIISNFMVNFQSNLLRIFTYNKKNGGIEKLIEEITASDSFLNTGSVINMLYHNIIYLRAMLSKITETTQQADVPGAVAQLAALFPPLLPEQQIPAFLQRLNALINDVVTPLETSIREFRLTVSTNSYKTILGEASHAAFVESIISEKVPPISYANRNNKFIVVSDFITDVHGSENIVTITIPDDYYDLATLGSAIEKELCDKCKWKVDANVLVRDMIWSCKYDENKKMQLKLYFPQNYLMKRNNIIPNIHDAYPAGFIHPAIAAAPAIPPGVTPANNIFQVSGGYIRAGVFKTLTIPQGEYRDISHLLTVMAKTINDFIGNQNNVELTQAYKTKMAITLDAAAGNRVKFEFKPNNRTPLGIRETLTVTLNNEYLSIILGSTLVRPPPPPPLAPFVANSYIFYSRPAAAGQFDEHTMGLNYTFRSSKSIKIQTRMQIDGDDYDASTIFGIPSSIASAGVITITPEITIRELALENNKIKVNEMLDDYLGFSQLIPLPPLFGPVIPFGLEQIYDYGVLNFTGAGGAGVNVGVAGQTAAITTLDAVDLSKIVSKVNGDGDNRGKLKTELVEKTGLYINNSLLHAKVPVITYTDILNSLFYRYPCIPSAADMILEGTPKFDKFIEERVNVSKFKDVVWLGKGKNDASETLSLTIRKALDKTLMYDDCDEERSKLMCDLHYAICGPVFTNTALRQQNQYGETDELEMFHQFQLEIKRPDILNPGPPALVAPQPRPIVKPFTVKGITPYYDTTNKRYKYLIYGHYLDFTIAGANDRQVGCVKYYDPGNKIGPQPSLMQLYDILRFTLAGGGPTTVNSVVEVNFNKDDESFVYPVFTIAGVFDTVRQYGGNGNDVGIANSSNTVLWTPGKMETGLPLPNDVVHMIYAIPPPVSPERQVVQAEINRIAAAPLVPSNSFRIFWNYNRIVGAPAFPLSSNIISIETFRAVNLAGRNTPANMYIMSILNVYIKTCHQCIITKSTANDNTEIHLPYFDVVNNRIDYNQILNPAGPPLKISCGAVSINKDIFNINKQIHFYQKEYLVAISSIPAGALVTPRLNDIQAKINDLVARFNALIATNDHIVNNMLWIGLKARCVDGAGNTQREILSCSIIDHLLLNQVPDISPVNFDVTFKDGDFIEKIKVDINDPEIVIVFGKFTATIQDSREPDITKRKPNKIIQNVMVIYTNMENRYNNNVNFGIPPPVPPPPPPPPPAPLPHYSLEYDNFQPITINGLPEFQELQGYYSCVDGLIVASNHGGGTMQQNMGTLLVKKNQAATPVVIGFHDHKITELTIDEQYSDASDIWSSILCYDYNMCADIIQYDETTNPTTTVIDKGLFNPLSFNAFKTTLKNVDVVVNGRPPYVYTTNQQRITELFNGEFVLVASKQSRPTNTLSKTHVLNTWGIDLSNEYTPFYKRIFEYAEGSKKFKLEIYEKYINKVVDTIIGSAKKYYKDKIKNSLYDEEYGTITNPNSPPPDIRFRRQGNRNVIIGGGRREDASAMIVAKNIELEEMKKLQRYNNNKETQQEISVIEIRVPDIMMSDAYLAKLTPEEKIKVRKSFFDALYKYSKKLKEIAKQENANDLKTIGGQGNVVIKDVYKVVLCSLQLAEFKFDDMYKDKKAGEDVDEIESFLSVATELYDYGLNDVTDNGIKNVILVNEWNDRGFIGDFGAFAAASSTSLTPNQMIISKTVKANPGAVAANQVVEYVPKVPNSSFLMNPFITYGTFDSSRWSGFDSMIDDNKGENETRIQVGGVPPEDDLRNLQMELLRRRRQQQQEAQYEYDYGRRGQGQGRFYNGYDDPRQRYMEDDDDFGQILKLQRRAFEKTNISSTQLKEVSIRAMQTDIKLKRVVLWLCDFREGKMLMVKTHIGPNVILSLPSQQQFPGGNKLSGYALLQQLCKRFFKTDAVIRKWTPEYAYIYSSTATGVFIYSAKSNELPKETMDTAFVPMKAIFNMATETKGGQALQISISNSDKSIVEEIFKVVALIQGGLISSTSKEFNDIVARLVTRTIPPHLRSVISESKRKTNIEANVNFLIKLFFSPNNLFFVRGNAPYYIYSTQRNCKIYTIVKQEGYDDDSYLTCLKLFLQTEADFKNKDKGKASNFRVGCAVKKKLITDNFSAVWDNFWGDLIESEEQSKYDDQLAIDVEGKEGVAEGEGKVAAKGKEKGKADDNESSTICLELAKQSGVRMYDLPEDWNVSKYWPMQYKNVYYNIGATEKYRFNNEYFYDLHLAGDMIVARYNDYLGFNCIAYYKNKNNPVLFLGDMGNLAEPQRAGRVYKLDLKTQKLTKFIETNVNGRVLCMDILNVEGQGSFMLVGGIFTQIVIYNDVNVQVQHVATILPVVLINLNTYEIILVYAPAPLPVAGAGDSVTKVCICKTKKIVKAKGGAQVENVEGHVALIGGIFEIDVTNDNNPIGPPRNNRERIRNIGCVLIRKNPNNPNNMEARLVAVDSKVALNVGGVRSEITNTAANFDLKSIICQENEDKTETVFFIGGRFNRYNSIDYVAYEASKVAGAVVLQPPANTVCNGIIKLKLKCEYDSDDTVSEYNQASVIEPIVVNTLGNVDTIINASLQYGIINSKKYLFCLTAFLSGLNVNTMLNVYDIESKLNVLQIQMPQPVPPLPPVPPVPAINYIFQTLLLTKDNDNHNVLIMSFTKNNALPFNYTYTCNISDLNKDAAPPIEVIAVASNENNNISKDNYIRDMVYREDTGEVFIAHMWTGVNSTTEYPLTVRSNYQEIGEWKLKRSILTDDANELGKIDKFMDKVFEIRKIFKFNPSMNLFLQDVDFRDYNDITSKITRTMLEKMNRDLVAAAATAAAAAAAAAVRPPVAAGFSWFTAVNCVTPIFDSPCNDIDKKIKNIMNFVDALKNLDVLLISPVRVIAAGVNTANAISEKMYNFVNDLLFMLVYIGCNDLAQLICNDYVDLVITPPQAAPPGAPPAAPPAPAAPANEELNRTTWKSRFNAIISKSKNQKIKELIDNIGQKVIMYKGKLRITPDTRYNFKICSDPKTHTGVSYLEYNYNQNINSLIALNNQNNLKNRIYDSDKDSFFSSNEQFHTNEITDDLGNTMEQINFCSFYKFNRLTMPPAPVEFGNIGNADSETVYVSVDIDGNGINSNQVFEFLNIIREYFMNLKRGAPDVDIGISGPIKRLTFGGDFGCNLLSDVKVCRKFKSNQMKIYTMEKNNSVLIHGNDGSIKNQIFVIDVDLEQVLQGGGGNGGDYKNDNSNQKRICIGARIEEDKHRVVINKRRTRRKVPLMLSSS